MRNQQFTSSALINPEWSRSAKTSLVSSAGATRLMELMEANVALIITVCSPGLNHHASQTVSSCK